MFANPSFELGGTAPWRMDKGGRTAARFTVDTGEAFAGGRSALVTIDTIDEWGSQFGQTLDAGQKGKTYTFAVLAKSTRGPVAVDLQIERRAKPWDRAARSKKFTLRKDKWTELHVTFRVEKAFPQGWFAYISCTQPRAQYRADMFRLYEGEYEPYKEVARQEAASAAVHLFDTGTSSVAPLSADAFSRRDGWRKVPEDEVAHKFRGDAVFFNNRIAVVLRRRGRGAEVYGMRRKGMKIRARVTPATSAGGARLSSVKIAKNDPSAVALEASFVAANGKTLGVGYELGMGQVFVKTEARGVARLRVEAPCRFVVLPDFFADDIVVDATGLPVSPAELPSEHFLLHLLGDGEAIVMSVWNVSEEDVRITLSGKDREKLIAASEIHYGRKGKIWVAVLEGPEVWHTRDVAKGDAGRIIRLDWKRPYPAQWRVDWRRDDRLTGSWEMIAQRPDGRFVKYGWFGSPGTIPANRNRWTTVLGRFAYPCWTDKGGRGYLQPLRRVIRFQGPAVVYPINRARTTPLDRFTVVDIVRGTLGVGPCEYILDVEGQQSRYKGRATCSARDTLRRIYARKQQKQKKAEIEKVLVDVMIFIRHIRGRIENYVAFGHELLKYLAAQKRAHPELARHLSELETLTKAIDAYVAKRKEKIKTVGYAAKLAEEFRKTLIDYEGADAFEKCKRITHGWVEIGGNQDELVGECRMAVKWVRQRAGLLMALEPRMAEVAKEIRRRTQKVLRNPAGHEGARH